MTARQWRLALAVCALAFVPGCGSDPFAVGGEPLCRQRDDLTSCTDANEYFQEETIRWEVRSARTDTVFFDACSTQLARDRGSEGFDQGYLPTLNCGSGAGLPEVLANMVPIPPGGVFRGTTTLSSVVPQGRYRMNLWIVDATGTRLSLGPYFTPAFAVLPSVNPVP